MIAIALAATLAYQVGPPIPSGQLLIDELSKRAVKYFWEQSSPLTGFTKDRAKNLATSDSYDVASVAATGYGLSALAIGAERGWIDRSAALNRTRLTLQKLIDVAPKNRGWFYHWIHWQTGARMWNSEVSSIDSAILFAGCLLAERSWNDSVVTQRVNQIMGAVDWEWMRTRNGERPTSQYFSHGWKPETGFLASDWSDYAEHLVLLVMAFGASPTNPSSMWTALRRPMVSYGGMNMLLGGPLFIHQLSHGYVDFENLRDPQGYDYWVSSRNQALSNRRYCINNPSLYKGYGKDCWGLSACDGPDGYNSFGAPGWITDNGTIAPASAVASIMFTPAESRAAADYFATKQSRIWGRYGFSNGFNPGRNWVDQDVIGIDLGFLLLGIENERDNLPHRRFMSHPTVVGGMARINWHAAAVPSRKSFVVKE